jgi:hypothetical protein
VLPVTESPDEFDSVTRTTTLEEEEAAFKDLDRLFEAIDRWQASDEQEGARSVHPNSPLAGDDLAADPFRVSHAAIYGIVGAIDHLHSLRMLIKTAASLHTFAPFTLNRAAIEGGAVAVWLLAPRTRDERIRRRLVLAKQNARDVDGVLATLGETSSFSDQLDEIRRVAARRPALDPKWLVGSSPGIERIVSEAGAAFDLSSEAAVTSWKPAAASPIIASGPRSTSWIVKSSAGSPMSAIFG